MTKRNTLRNTLTNVPSSPAEDSGQDVLSFDKLSSHVAVWGLEDIQDSAVASAWPDLDLAQETGRESVCDGDSYTHVCPRPIL